ncbi:MAG TPA: glycosyl transferase, partial [Cyanobacteria bacterium UBA11049]|nr:glycosyl transferase [Cyanobacteria bacterium UBA11049]
FQLLARSPAYSAARVFTPAQIFIGYAIFAVFLCGITFDWWHSLAILITLLNLFFGGSVLFKMVLSLIGAADRTHQITKAEVYSIDEQSLPIYSVLVPVYNEPEVTPILIEALSKLDYPHEKLDVLLLLEEKDLETIQAARAANPPRYVRFIYIPDSHPKTKPKACNYGLAFARGEYLTIYDAEDIPDPDQLKKAIYAFRHGSPSLVCVQAALNYYNRNENFLTRMFTLEYSYWFDYLLPGLETLDLPIPLGGTSNHFRTDRLRELGGWDPFNVTEDADLGIRASKRGYTVGVVNSTTYEEANCELRNWIRQRSRWIKGYMQTWLVHNRHPLKSLKTLGLKSWLAYQFLIGGTVLIFLTSPILWLIFIYWIVTRAYWLESLIPGWVLYISLFNLSISNALGIYLNMIAVFRRRYYQLILYALLNPLYWQLHSIAAYMALWQLFSKPFYWEKTIHGISKFTKSYLPFSEKNETSRTA